MAKCKCVELATAYFRHYSDGCLNEVRHCETKRIMATGFWADIQNGEDSNRLLLKQHLRGSRRPSLQSTCNSLPEVAGSAPGGSIGSPDHSSAVLFNPSIRKTVCIYIVYFVWNLSVATSCRLAYLINVANSTDRSHALRCNTGNWQVIVFTWNSWPKPFK